MLRSSRAYRGSGVATLLGAALSIGCSSSDDVIAVVGAPGTSGSSVSLMGGEPALEPMVVVGGSAVVPPPPRSSFHVIGTPQLSLVEIAEPWPFELPPLGDFFMPRAPGDPSEVILSLPEALALRPLAIKHGLSPGRMTVPFVVEDSLDDRYELVVWEE